MNRSSEIEIKVGIFVSLGLALIMLSIALLGGGQAIFESNDFYHAKFNQIEGLVEGATVKISGVRVGQVSSINFLRDSNLVDVTFSVTKKFAGAVHVNSTVGVQTQGMLGDRFIVIETPSTDTPIAANGAELKVSAGRELKDYLTDADEVLDRLKTSLEHMDTILGSFSRDNRADTFFRNISGFSTRLNDSGKGLGDSMDHFRSIMGKIDNGEGTIGALVNDPALYDDLRSLLGGANRNRVLKYFIKKSVEESREAASKDKK